MRLFSILFCAVLSLSSLSSQAFSEHYISEDEKFYIDRFDFPGEFPEMETMEIHAQRKKRVHLNATGYFPKLESIVYNGSFGFLRAKLTGEFPELTSVSFICSTCRMDMDFRGKWGKDAHITLGNEREPITLTCPQDVGVIVHTEVSMKGKVIIEGQYKKVGRGLWKKTYHNSLVGIAPVTLVFTVRSGESGVITLR